MTINSKIAQFAKEGFSKIIKNLELSNKETLLKNIDLIDFNKCLTFKNLNSFKDNDKAKYLDQYYKKKYLSNYGFIKIGDYSKLNGIVLIDPNEEEQIISDYFKDSNIKKIYHYTNLESLIKIIKSKTIRLSSISSLNDRSEISNAEDVTKDKIKQPFHHGRIKSFNSRFVMSCTHLSDNLNQWRLYGNDGKSICIEFTIKPFDNNGFMIGEVRYGKKLLNEIQCLIQNIYKKFGFILVFRKLNFWNCFMKAVDYSEEKEVRLLYLHNEKNNQNTEWEINRYGILSRYIYFNFKNFPLYLSRIILGPKLSEKELNQGQLKQFMKEHQIINYKKIYLSKITHYR